jgi:hypothetical protein
MASFPAAGYPSTVNVDQLQAGLLFIGTRTLTSVPTAFSGRAEQSAYCRQLQFFGE